MRFLVTVLATMSLGLGSSTFAASKQCKAQVERVKQQLERVPEYPVLLRRAVSLELPVLDGAPQIARSGYTLEYHAGWMAFEGQMLTDIDVRAALETRLADIHTQEQKTKLVASPMYLRLDRNARLKDVLPVMCAAGRGRSLGLVTSSKGPSKVTFTPPPLPASLSEVEAQLAKATDPLQRTLVLAKAFEAAVGECESVRKLFLALMGVVPSRRPAMMRRAVTVGLEECDCKTNIEALEALAVRILVPDTPPSSAVMTVLDCVGPAQKTLELAPDTPVQSVVEQVHRLGEVKSLLIRVK